MNWKIKALVIILIAMIVVGIGYAAILFQKPETEPPAKPPIKEIDDRISPLTTQAVFFQVSRIRHKGIIDQMYNSGLGIKILNSLPIRNELLVKYIDGLLPGLGWDEKPTFNYMTILDGYEFKGRVDFNSWDTDYINHEFYRLVEEEQPTTMIEFKFIEKEKKLFRTIEKVIESFSVIYDFKTGRWEGDDYFNDSDGYGHYDGSDFEMWFQIRQTDFDADGIPYWTEVNLLGTNPRVDDRVLDPDEDDVPTAWEWRWGYDPNSWDNHTFLDPDKDGLQNNEEYFMDKWLANPFYPEIYIESDWLEKAPFKPLKIEIQPGRIFKFIQRPMLVKTRLDGWEHTFYEESQQMLMDRFNDHGITVHIDDGCMGGGGEILPFGVPGEVVDSREYEEGAFHQEKGLIAEYYHNKFADERKGIFRYCVIAHGGGWAHAQDYKGYYDCMCIPVNKEFYKNIFMAPIGTPRIKRIGLAVSMLHELGHTLGFNLTYHGGVDNLSEGAEEMWKNYRSCMTYLTWWERYFDYSDGTHGENDKDDWSNLDLAYFQRAAQELEGLGFDGSVPPYNR
jgi:hypothetical protein